MRQASSRVTIHYWMRHWRIDVGAGGGIVDFLGGLRNGSAEGGAKTFEVEEVQAKIAISVCSTAVVRGYFDLASFPASLLLGDILNPHVSNQIYALLPLRCSRRRATLSAHVDEELALVKMPTYSKAWRFPLSILLLPDLASQVLRRRPCPPSPACCLFYCFLRLSKPTPSARPRFWSAPSFCRSILCPSKSSHRLPASSLCPPDEKPITSVPSSQRTQTQARVKGNSSAQNSS
jgi:hypothetical protein